LKEQDTVALIPSADIMEFANIEIRELPLMLKSVRRKVDDFLASNGLLLDEGLDYYAGVFPVEGDTMLAGAGLQGNVIKCIAVAPEARDLSLSNKLVSHLRSICFERGYSNIFAFTKPENEKMFQSLAFHIIAHAPKAIFCESSSNGISAYAQQLSQYRHEGSNGVIVMNCNPITLGHRYLIETASQQVDRLHVILVKEDKSVFPFDVRLRLVKETVADLANVVVHEGSSYVLSAATFPSYFIKEPSLVALTQIQLDLDLFAHYIAPALGATVRFVGSEPFDELTSNYNHLMHETLPQQGVEVREIERKQLDAMPISASLVRDLLAEGKLDQALTLLPTHTQQFVQGEQGRAIIERLSAQTDDNKIPGSLRRQLVHAMSSAMLEELNTTGKPGLVCPDTQGSHKDIDYAVMSSCIHLFAQQSKDMLDSARKGQSPLQAIAAAQQVAVSIIDNMTSLAHGANTYRGAVFSLGLTAFAYAYCRLEDGQVTEQKWMNTIKEMAAFFQPTEETKGGRAVKEYNIRGALAMAGEAYDVVFHKAVPYYESLKEDDNNSRRLHTLIYIMSQIDDSNIYHRSGADVAHEVKRLAAVAAQDFTPAHVEALRGYCQEQWVSPGGAADMLILTLFISHITRNKY